MNHVDVHIRVQLTAVITERNIMPYTISVS